VQLALVLFDPYLSPWPLAEALGRGLALPRLEKLVGKAVVYVIDESARRIGLIYLLDRLALCPISTIEALSATSTAIGHQPNDTDQPIEKAVGHGTAHIGPAAVRTPRVFVTFFHPVPQYARPTEPAPVQPSRPHQRSKIIAATSARREELACESMGAAISRVLPQFSSLVHQSSMIAGVTSAWNCKP
jgi:hypothetical protein